MMYTAVLTLPTPEQTAFINITEEVQGILAQSDAHQGSVVVAILSHNRLGLGERA